MGIQQALEETLGSSSSRLAQLVGGFLVLSHQQTLIEGASIAGYIESSTHCVNCSTRRHLNNYAVDRPSPTPRASEHAESGTIFTYIQLQRSILIHF